MDCFSSRIANTALKVTDSVHVYKFNASDTELNVAISVSGARYDNKNKWKKNVEEELKPKPPFNSTTGEPFTAGKVLAMESKFEHNPKADQVSDLITFKLADESKGCTLGFAPEGWRHFAFPYVVEYIRGTK